MGGLIARIGALSTAAKVLLIVAAPIVLGLCVLFSPYVVVLAYPTFFFALLLLIARSLQRRPAKAWGVVAAASLVTFLVFSGISHVLYGGG